jgi:hypothetical protein
MPGIATSDATRAGLQVPRPCCCPRYYGVSPVLLPDTAHDAMLDTRWEAAAASLRGWLDGLPPAATAAGSRPAVAASS